MASLVWLHGGACNGNTQSFLNAEEPTVVDLVTDFGIDVIYHHSFIPLAGEQANDTLRRVLKDGGPDIFVFEGSVIQGPNGSGRYDIFLGRPMQEWVREYAAAAKFIVAIGDCACWGGIPATKPNPTDSIGLQYLKTENGGFLGADLPEQGRPAGHQHPGLPRASRLGDSDPRRDRDRAPRRHRARRPRPAADVLQDVHADGLHPRAVLRVERSRSKSSARARARAASSTSRAAAGR